MKGFILVVLFSCSIGCTQLQDQMCGDYYSKGLVTGIWAANKKRELQCPPNYCPPPGEFRHTSE